MQGKQGGEGRSLRPPLEQRRQRPGLSFTKDKFLDRFFLYDNDGYQSYCSICCAGNTLLICENPDCTR